MTVIVSGDPLISEAVWDGSTGGDNSGVDTRGQASRTSLSSRHGTWHLTALKPHVDPRPRLTSVYSLYNSPQRLCSCSESRNSQQENHSRSGYWSEPAVPIKQFNFNVVKFRDSYGDSQWFVGAKTRKQDVNSNHCHRYAVSNLTKWDSSIVDCRKVLIYGVSLELSGPYVPLLCSMQWQFTEQTQWNIS